MIILYHLAFSFMNEMVVQLENYCSDKTISFSLLDFAVCMFDLPVVSLEYELNHL